MSTGHMSSFVGERFRGPLYNTEDRHPPAIVDMMHDLAEASKWQPFPNAEVLSNCIAAIGEEYAANQSWVLSAMRFLEEHDVLIVDKEGAIFFDRVRGDEVLNACAAHGPVSPLSVDTARRLALLKEIYASKRCLAPESRRRAPPAPNLRLAPPAPAIVPSIPTAPPAPELTLAEITLSELVVLHGKRLREEEIASDAVDVVEDELRRRREQAEAERALIDARLEEGEAGDDE